MEIKEFNALELREGSIVKVEMKPEAELKSPGLYSRFHPDLPRAGYFLGLSESGYRAFMTISYSPEMGGSVCATPEDAKSITIFERSEEGELAKIAQREDGKGTCIVHGE